MTDTFRRKTGGWRPLTAAAVVLVVACASPAAAQCAMCRSALQSPEGQQLVGALRAGILLLLAAPFVVFGVVATLAVRRFRRDRLTECAGGP